jgi:hypothetical protein
VDTPLYPWLHDPEYRRVQMEDGDRGGPYGDEFLK